MFQGCSIRGLRFPQTSKTIWATKCRFWPQKGETMDGHVIIEYHWLTWFDRDCRLIRFIGILLSQLAFLQIPNYEIHWPISQSLIKVPDFVNVLNSIKAAVDECDNNRGILVEIRCKSGRHRSVCAGFCSYHQMRRRGHSATLVHYESAEWTSMKCGGTCSACRDHQKCLEKIGSILLPQHSGPILAPTSLSDFPTSS